MSKEKKIVPFSEVPVGDSFKRLPPNNREEKWTNAPVIWVKKSFLNRGPNGEMKEFFTAHALPHPPFRSCFVTTISPNELVEITDTQIVPLGVEQPAPEVNENEESKEDSYSLAPST